MPTTLNFNVGGDGTSSIAGRVRTTAMLFPARSTFSPTAANPGLLNPTAPKMFDEDGNGIYSSVLLDSIEWEGPIETEAERATRGGVLPPDDSTTEVVASYLQRFAERAWRRPVSLEELETYLSFLRI